MKMLLVRLSFLSLLLYVISVLGSLENNVINYAHATSIRKTRSLGRGVAGIGSTAIKVKGLLRVMQAKRILLAYAKEIKRTTDARGNPIVYLAKSGGLEKAKKDFWLMVLTDYKVKHSYGENWELYTGRFGNNIVEFLKSDSVDTLTRIKMYSKDGGQIIVNYGP